MNHAAWQRTLTRRSTSCLIAGAAALVLGAAFPMDSHAQSNYPSQTIRIVTGFPAGGGSDLLSRLLAPKLQEKFGQPVVVDNRPGASGRIGADAVARAEPDGYTLYMATEGAIVIAPHLVKDMTYDALKDLKPVSLVVRTAPLISVHPSHDAKDMKQLLELAKANPGKYNYGHSGVGGPNHLAFEMLKQMAGIDITDIAYKGTGAVIPAALSNEVGILIAYLPSSMPHIRSGALRPLAVTSAERSPSLPDVPTVAESGVEGYELSSWIGLFAPKDTPDDVVETLNAAIKDALKLEDVRSSIESGGQSIVGNSAAEFKAAVQSDFDKYAALLKSLGIENE